MFSMWTMWLKNFYKISSFCVFLVQKQHPNVLANTFFYNWRLFGQNSETIRFLSLQRCRTAGALIGLNLCGYVFYLNYVVKKYLSIISLLCVFIVKLINIQIFWRTHFSTINVYSAKTRRRFDFWVYKDVAPLVLWLD